MRNRLLDKPSYTINSNRRDIYKATILMKMDCDCFPYEGLTRLTSVDDLYKKYGVSNSQSYNIAKKFLSTNKINIVGINRQASDNIRTTVATYNWDDRIVSIYPSYKTLLDKDTDYLTYSFEFFLGDLLGKQKYFKIYNQENKQYICALIDVDTLNTNQKNLLEYNTRLLLYNLFGLAEKNCEIIIVPISKNDTLKDISVNLRSKLTEYRIKYYLIEADDNIKIEFSFENNLHEEYKTNCRFEKVYNSNKHLEFVDEDSVIEHEKTNEWYAHRLLLNETDKHFYFKKYITQQRSLLVCVAYMEELDNVDRYNLEDSSQAVREATARSLFKLEQSFASYIEIIKMYEGDNEVDLSNRLLKILRKYGILFEFEAYDSNKYLTLYSTKMSEPILTNLEQDINYKKSYDLDYIANYGNMLFSAYSKLCTSAENISIEITQFGKQYNVAIVNSINGHTYDTEVYQSTSVTDIANMITNNSKYIVFKAYGDTLPIGNYTLKLFNTDLTYTDDDFFLTINKIDKGTLLFNRVDFIYNFNNDIKWLSKYNNLRSLVGDRIILFSDVICTPKKIKTYDFSRLFEYSENFNEFLDSNKHLPTNVTVRDAYFLYDNLIYLYNYDSTPKKFNSNKYYTFGVVKLFGKSKKISEIIKLVNEHYNSYYRDNALLPAINNYLSMKDSDKVSVSVDNATGKLVLTLGDKVIKDIDSTKLLKDNIKAYGSEFFTVAELQALQFPEWNEDTVAIPLVDLNIMSVDLLNKNYDDIVLTEHSINESTSLLLDNILKGSYEFDYNGQLPLFDVYDMESIESSLRNIYNTGLVYNGLYINRFWDNEYYFSMLNPCGTFRKTITPLYDYIPTILQINHALNKLTDNSVDIDSLDDAKNLLNEAIKEVGQIVPIYSKLELTNFEKINRLLKIRLSVYLYKSTKMSYSFNITINT